MGNGLTRLADRFYGEPASVDAARRTGSARPWTPRQPRNCGLVTFAYDETDWDDEVRIMLEERASVTRPTR